MNIRFLSVSVLAACLGASAITGCNLDQAEQTLESTGVATLPLTAVGPDGATYRLDSATFQVTGTQAQTLQSGEEAALNVTLPVGSYQIALASGWQLTRVVNGIATPVAATLASPASQSFAISNQAVTDVLYTFSVGGVTIPLGSGVARVGIEVIDGSTGTGTGTGTTTTTTNTNTIDAGYWTSGAWKGYAFTATDSLGTTITPANFDQHVAGTPYCAAGTVLADPSYGGFAMVGFNLNQSGDPSMARGVVVPTATGVRVNLTRRTSAALRVQLQGPNGDVDYSNRWCADVPAGSGDILIPYSSFNTQCWSNTGAFYARQPLQTAMLMVPGVADRAVPYDFCVNTLADGTSTSTSTSTTTTTTTTTTVPNTTGVLTGNYQSAVVTSAGKSYVVQNNVWGGNGSQTLSYNGTAFTITSQTCNNAGSPVPCSFPSAFIGNNNGSASIGSNLPRRASELTSLPTSWTWYNAPYGSYNAIYDLWFTASAAGAVSSPDLGLMVWLYRAPGLQPRGAMVATGVTIPGAAGTWSIWTDGKYTTYVASSTINSFTADLKSFIVDATARPGTGLNSAMYLHDVFAGFEIWSGGVGLKSESLSFSVN